jgi:cardiolipin synthase
MLAAIPNILTGFRLACAPVVLVALILSATQWGWALVAFVAFVAAAITDLFDGMIARALKAETAWGKTWDPIADKLLVAAALIGLIYAGALTGWALIAAGLILARDALVTWLRTRRSVPVSLLAKWKTAIEMIAVLLLLLGPALSAILIGAPQISYWAFFKGQYYMAAEAVLWLAAGLSVLSALVYLRPKPAVS